MNDGYKVIIESLVKRKLNKRRIIIIILFLGAAGITFLK